MRFKTTKDILHVPSMEGIITHDKGLVKAGTEFNIGTAEELKDLEDSQRVLANHLLGADCVVRIKTKPKTDEDQKTT